MVHQPFQPTTENILVNLSKSSGSFTCYLVDNFTFMISEQLKNMINVLHSSCDGGTKKFTLNGNQFGWKAIIKMYECEGHQVSSGIARMIPKLWEVHII